ncbi:unnamed protein product [Porites evermanni]|uniref:Calponin-homology (CH) domain-containing protein n=1 Tax=Porites evermanni TaxID=104178 RepID=A0ABN8M4L5_9CNID|nr:unnamed protein product [Porites evermanni]
MEPECVTPSKENCPVVNKVHSKRAQWYSPCKSSPKIPLTPESDLPTLKLTHFAKIPKISFGTVVVGNSKTEHFVVFNPHPFIQTLEIEKCPTDKGFTLKVNGNEENDNFKNNCVTIPPKNELFLSITWEPKEAGNYREIIRFRSDNSPQLQVIVFGMATAPTKRKSTAKRSSKTQTNKKMPRPILQPSQVLNVCSYQIDETTGFSNSPANKQAIKSSNGEDQSEENLRRDTYCVKSAKLQASSKLKVKSTPPSHSRSTTPTCKQSAVKTKKVVVSKKKLSPTSGTLKKKPKPKIKLTVSAKGVPQRKLQLVKTPRSNLPRHPMPFAAKNMYYDERWIEKQEEGFTKWLNFVLTPPDVSDSSLQVDIHKGNVALGGSKSQPLAPTKEVLSFRLYTARRKMARLRRSACLLYQSEPLGHIIRKIEAEVENGGLAIRPDKKLHADLGIKRQVVEMLLSYNPLWLRIGLETIYGEILPIQSNNDKGGLTRFLTERLLGNPDIANAFAHPQVPGLYREGYVEQLGKFTLKKFLLLVLFLDRAKLTRLIDHDPCLFNKEASFKSNRSILLSFSREYLKGEGDLTKHLYFLGYSVTHSQVSLKFIFSFNNLEHGVARVVELFTQDWKLSATLRVPAISRLQKIHNVDVFMNALKTRGVLGGNLIDARHVVDGHREKTLALLWQIIFHFQVKVLLNEKLLKEEIAHLESTRLLRDRLTAAENWDGNDDDFLGKRRDSASDLYFKLDRLRLLFKWCKMVCRIYGLKIENFTVSFSDGRALCYLLHHYHPSLLPLELIKEQTSLTCNPGVHDTSDSEGEEDVQVKSWTATFSPGSGKNTLLEELKDNERENLRLIAEKVKELGGVPLMTKASDMSHTIPDEKVVITYVAYLCSRLLDLREETKAARCIQMAWRRFRLNKQLERKKNVSKIVVSLQARARAALARRRFRAMKESAVVIQSVYRSYMVRKQLRVRHQAAQCIQTHYLALKKGREVLSWYANLRQTVVRLQTVVLGNQRKMRVKRNLAATVIQAAWRGYAVRRWLDEQCAACVKIQALVRSVLEQRRFLQVKNATVLIQKAYRATLLGRKERQRFLYLRACAVTLQSCYRGQRDRRLVKQIRAAVKIQSLVRAWRMHSKFLRLKRVTTKIQACTRRHQAQRRFAEVKEAVQILQVYFRAFLLGRRQKIEYDTQRAACVKIQSLVRCQIERRVFLRKRQAAVRLQSFTRMSLARKRYQRLYTATLLIQGRVKELLYARDAQRNFQLMKLSSIKIQSCYRGYRFREQFTLIKQATIMVQSHVRCFLSRKKFLALKRASTIIQTRYRALLLGRQQRQKYQHTHHAIVRLQAMVRGKLARENLLKQQRSAEVIQTKYRQYSAGKRYRQLKSSTVAMQRRFRSVLLTRKHVWRYQQMRTSAQFIQARYRGHLARKFYKMLKATVVLQSAVRGWGVRKDIKQQNMAALAIQGFYRCHVYRKKYLAIRKATIVLQNQYRLVSLGRKTRCDFQRIRLAAIKIQSSFRGCQVRKQVLLLTSARKIQAFYRGYVARKSYNISRNSIIIAQGVVRGYLARKHYSSLRNATILLQRRYRARVIGMQQYLHYHVQRGACILLQAAVRGYVYRKRYQEMRNAAIIFQQRYRAMTACRNQHTRFLAVKTAAICIQACVRGWIDRKRVTELRAVHAIQATFRMYKVRKEYVALRRAVVQIQAQTRMIQQRRQFNSLKKAALVVQRRFRATVLCKHDQLVYHFIRGAVITIQMVFRGHLVRKRLRRMNEAAVKIQAYTRRLLARKKYQATKKATLVLQLRCRAWLLGRAVARNYNAWKSAATKIQCAFRRHTCRFKFLSQKSAAVVIQAAFRCYVTRRFYLNLRCASTVIQQRYRAVKKMKDVRQHYIAQRKAFIALQARVKGWLCRRHYNSIRIAAITIQTRHRAGIKAREHRKDFLELKNATVILQSHWRMVSARRNYEKLRNAVIKIQSVVRMRKEAVFYGKLRNATLTLQKRCRANQLCKQQLERYQSMRKSAVIIQSQFRGFKARKCVQKMVAEKQRRQQAAFKIQRYYRGYRLMKETYFAYHVTRGAIITLQGACRMYSARKFVRKLRAVITMQAVCRGKIQRQEFLTVRKRICKVQATVRRNQARTRLERTRKAVVAIQQWYRARIAMKKTYKEYQDLRDATVLIQSYFRRHSQRQAYLYEKQMVVLTQSLLRMRLERNRFLQKRSAAIVIQRHYRLWIFGKEIRHRYLMMLSAIITMQSFFRGWKTRRELTRLKSAVLIQSNIRGWMERRKYHHTRELVIGLQATTRAWLCQKNYRQLKDATVLLQRRVRGNNASTNARQEYLETKRAAVALQSFYRGWQVRRYVVKLKAVILIQCWFRATTAARKAREEYKAFKEASLVLQAAYRGYCGRMFTRQLRAARTIQAVVRGFLIRRRIEQQKAERLIHLKQFASAVYHHMSAMKIQRCYRRSRAMALAKARMDSVLLIQYWWQGVMERKRFVKLRATAVFLQRATRRILEIKNRNAAKIQALVRGAITRKHLKKIHQSALQIQALWRGYRVRVGVSSLKVKRARKRIKSANAAATESMKLCNRTRSALDFLLQCKNISRIVGSLVNLEVVTRLSEVCCQQVVDDGALPVIFKVLKKCNRSLPHLEVIKYSVLILYNVVKYSSLYRAVYEEQHSIDTLVHLLVNLRDKSFIFSKTCCLLVVLCSDSSIVQDIRNMQKITEDIKGVHSITERNHKLETKRNVMKSKVDKTMNQLPPPTPCKHTPFKGKKSHKVKWQNRLDLVLDPLEAVRLLVRKLDLVKTDE